MYVYTIKILNRLMRAYPETINSNIELRKCIKYYYYSHAGRYSIFFFSLLHLCVQFHPICINRFGFLFSLSFPQQLITIAVFFRPIEPLPFVARPLYVIIPVFGRFIAFWSSIIIGKFKNGKLFVFHCDC